MSVQACPLEGTTRQIHDINGNIHYTTNKEMGSERNIRISKRGPHKIDTKRYITDDTKKDQEETQNSTQENCFLRHFQN